MKKPYFKKEYLVFSEKAWDFWFCKLPSVTYWILSCQDYPESFRPNSSSLNDAKRLLGE